MAITVGTGTGQTSVGTPITPLAPAPADYRVLTDDPGLTILKNIANDLTQPNAIRVQISPVADVFKGAEITAVAGQRTDGLSALVQLTEAWKVTDSVTGAEYLLPVSAHMVLKVPVDANIDGIILSALIARLVGTLDRGSVTMETTLSSIFHGVTRLPDYVGISP